MPTLVKQPNFLQKSGSCISMQIIIKYSRWHRLKYKTNELN